MVACHNFRRVSVALVWEMEWFYHVPSCVCVRVLRLCVCEALQLHLNIWSKDVKSVFVHVLLVSINYHIKQGVVGHIQFMII